MDPSTFLIARQDIQARMEQRRNALSPAAGTKVTTVRGLGLVAGPLMSWLFSSVAGEMAMPVVRQVAFAGVARLISNVASRLHLDRLLPRSLSKRIS